MVIGRDINKGCASRGRVKFATTTGAPIPEIGRTLNKNADSETPCLRFSRAATWIAR
jgi:hypothetical protein